MTKRRRFTAEFKARVALDALRGDKTIQEIAAKRRVHPNQVSTWKRQAMDGLGEVFSNLHGRLLCCGFQTPLSWHTDAIEGRPPHRLPEL